MDKKEIVFILLNYNQCELTIGAIKNILSLKGDIGLIVVDNNSSDGSYGKLHNMFQAYKEVQVFQSGINNGYAHGNNFGVRKACKIYNPKFIAIMNPDVRMYDKRIICNLIEAFSKNNKIAIATGFMLDINAKLYFNNLAWKIPKGIDDVFLNISVINHFYNPVAYKNLKMSTDRLFYVEVVPGSFFIIRKKIFEKVGLFDESTFLMCEERILGRKLKKADFKTVLVPNCFFFHNHYSMKQSFMSIIKSYSLLIRSRWYYNLNYNSESKFIILPLFVISVFIGYIERIIIWMIKNIIKRH